MHRHAIKDDQWELIKNLLPGQMGQPGVTAKDNRLFIDAVLWIARTGAPWRDLPEKFGPWNSVWRRFARWSKKGVWQRIANELGNPDLAELILDSTVIRAHQHAAGKKGDPRVPRSVGRAVGSAPKYIPLSTGRVSQRDSSLPADRSRTSSKVQR
jgi:transposase